MEILLFGQHFAEYILTLGGGFPAKENVTICLSENNFNNEIPANSSIGNGVKTFLLPMPGPGSPWVLFKSVMKFRKLLKKIKPDIIHFQELPKIYTFVCWLLARRSIRILTIHDVQSHPGGDSATSNRQEFFRNYMRKTADHLIVHGNQLLSMIEQHEPALVSKTIIIPHPAFRVRKPQVLPEVVEGQLLFFGRISKYKGLRYLLEACVTLQQKGFNFNLVIAGNGDDFESNRESLKNIRNLTVINRHILPNEVDHLFNGSDIIVLPYIEASQSGVVAYALGFGKPCIASRTGSIPEMVRDRFNGLLSVPADAESLAQCLEELLDNKQLKQQFSANASHLAATVYSPETVAQSTLALYKTIEK